MFRDLAMRVIAMFFTFKLRTNEDKADTKVGQIE